MKPMLAAGVICAALALAAALIAAMLDLPASAVALPQAVAANLDQSGVRHPVTAVLLNFRGYDTLLEVAVLLLALLSVLAVGGERDVAHAVPPGEPVLQTLARLLVPLMILTAGYLLWAGAHRPGGAFQAAAVLLQLARLLPTWIRPGLLLRLGLTSGFLIFLAVAAALLAEGSLLQYPPAWAGILILFIEAGLTCSLSLTLAGLFLFLTGQGERTCPPV
jgi:multisubunit Na+/H+ antiporter MnhB subunit